MPLIFELGDRFEAGLAGLDLELRRCGLFMGLKLPSAGDGPRAAADLIRAGVFVLFANNDPSVVQLLPPLILGDDEADHVIAAVRAALG